MAKNELSLKNKSYLDKVSRAAESMGLTLTTFTRLASIEKADAVLRNTTVNLNNVPVSLNIHKEKEIQMGANAQQDVSSR